MRGTETGSGRTTKLLLIYLAIFVIGLSVSMYTTRSLAPESLWTRILPFAFPVTLAVLSGIARRASAPEHAVKSDARGLSVSGRAMGTGLGPTSIQPTTFIALTMFTPLFIRIFPNDGSFSSQTRLIFSAWWITWAVIIAFVIPRSIRPK